MCTTLITKEVIKTSLLHTYAEELHTCSVMQGTGARFQVHTPMQRTSRGPHGGCNEVWYGHAEWLGSVNSYTVWLGSVNRICAPYMTVYLMKSQMPKIPYVHRIYLRHTVHVHTYIYMYMYRIFMYMYHIYLPYIYVYVPYIYVYTVYTPGNGSGQPYVRHIPASM